MLICGQYLGTRPRTDEASFRSLANLGDMILAKTIRKCTVPGSGMSGYPWAFASATCAQGATKKLQLVIFLSTSWRRY
jgi:hypothetical protein